MLTVIITNIICGLLGFILFKKAMDEAFPNDTPPVYILCIMAVASMFAGVTGLISGLIFSVLIMTLKLFGFAREKMFYVEGGIYKDFTFSDLDKSEFYGPFNSYDDAYDAWKASVWSNVDNALHRLTIKEK